MPIGVGGKEVSGKMSWWLRGPRLRPYQATDHRSVLVTEAVTASGVNGDWDKGVLSVEGVFLP